MRSRRKARARQQPLEMVVVACGLLGESVIFFILLMDYFTKIELTTAMRSEACSNSISNFWSTFTLFSLPLTVMTLNLGYRSRMCEIKAWSALEKCSSKI